MIDFMPKSILESTTSFLLKSNIFIALGASCVAYITLFLFNFPADPVVISVTFFEFFIAYNLNRLTDFNEDAINAPERISFVNKYTKPFIAMGAIIYAGILLQVMSANVYSFLFILVQTLLGLAYSICRIKKYFLIKNIYIAFVWGMIVLFVGVNFYALTTSTILFSVIIALIFFVNNTIFDIKDIAGDVACNLKTIPSTIGLKKTIIMDYAINTVAFFLLGVGLIDGLFPNKTILLSLLFIYIYFYLYMHGKLNEQIYYDLLVDGEFIFTAYMVFLYGAFYG
jgi:4-hydroxybenzoate polyprenyltransferase